MQEGFAGMVNVQWATSLPPRENPIEQAERLETWGGTVTAYHVADELPHIVDSYPKVSVVSVLRSGQALLGKPVPMLSDILEHQAQSTGQVFGLCNADIRLELSEAQRSWLLEQAQTHLVCIRRTDVSDLAMPLQDGHQLPQGYDTFLYPRTMIASIQADGFCLGAPFWDFWLPVAACLAGYPVSIVTAPIARHVEHPTAWDDVALPFMHIFVSSVQRAAERHEGAGTILGAVLGHQCVAYGAWFDLAVGDSGAAEVMSRVYDDFQERILGALVKNSKVYDDL